MTKGLRPSTFFGRGIVAHVSAAHPFSAELSAALVEAVQQAGGKVHAGGTFVTIEGPRFSTKAESELYRRWGMSIIGMTTATEAFLAAEAEIAYACMAHVTDFDVWHETERPVTAEMVMSVLAGNLGLAQAALDLLIRDRHSWEGTFPAHTAMREALALVGDWSSVPLELREELGPLLVAHLGPRG
jgi:5'-methylthioadenosine phosphorylase